MALAAALAASWPAMPEIRAPARIALTYASVWHQESSWTGVTKTRSAPDAHEGSAQAVISPVVAPFA